MGLKLLKTVQTITTFRNPLRTPWKPVADPLWSADPSLKTAAPAFLPHGVTIYYVSFLALTRYANIGPYVNKIRPR